MARAEEAWRDVGESFSELGAKLKRHFEKSEGAEGEARGRALEEALRQLAEGLQKAVDGVGKAVRDPEVQEHARKATASLGEALTLSFGELSDQVRERIGRSREQGPTMDRPIEGDESER